MFNQTLIKPSEIVCQILTIFAPLNFYYEFTTYPKNKTFRKR